MSRSSAHRRALRARVYHAPELAAGARPDLRGRTDDTRAEAGARAKVEELCGSRPGDG